MILIHRFKYKIYLILMKMKIIILIQSIINILIILKILHQKIILLVIKIFQIQSNNLKKIKKFSILFIVSSRKKSNFVGRATLDCSPRVNGLFTDILEYNKLLSKQQLRLCYIKSRNIMLVWWNRQTQGTLVLVL